MTSPLRSVNVDHVNRLMEAVRAGGRLKMEKFLRVASDIGGYTPETDLRYQPDGLWWAVVTTTTVGYGDIAPKTGTGRLIAVVLMLVGTALIATIAASVSAYFIGVERTEEYEDIKKRLDRIERILNPDK